jgi:Restriction Enzyme Adenine Methylase Associated
MWVEIEEDLAAVVQEQTAQGESRERIVNRLLQQALGEHSAPSRPAVRTRVSVAGSLKDLLCAGLIAEGDAVRYTEVRRGTIHVGRIDSDGRIRTDKGVHSSPSTALRQLVNYSMNGWKCWIHAPTGKSLAQLRAEIASQR